jgi:hypothetical protein
MVFCQPKSHILIMSKLVTKKHSYADILKGSMAQTQNKNQKIPTHEKPVPATVLPNTLDTETKTFNCTPKDIYVEIIKMSSPQTYKFKKVVCEEILRRVRRYSSANKDIPFKTPLFIYSVTTPFFVLQPH